MMRRPSFALAAVCAGSMLTGCLAGCSRPAKQYDLLCAGTANTTMEGGAEEAKSAKGFTHRYRIDLDRGLWCADECKSVMSLGEIQDNKLTLIDMSQSAGGSSARANAKINRLTGALQAEIQTDIGGVRTSRIANGTCEKKPFSGLPGQKF